MQTQISRQAFGGSSSSRSLPIRKPCSAQHGRLTKSPRAKATPSQDTENLSFESLKDAAILGATGLVAPWLFDVQGAFAKEREFGILEGRIASLYHPLQMGFLFGASLYAAWLGFQWRRLRTMPDKIKDLEADLPPKDSEGKRPPSPELESQIKELKQQRTELSKSNVRGKHANWGFLILGVGVITGIEGPVNTYLRSGKLFPGPHLYAGAAIVALWAGAASLVPLMNKGNDTARLAHISLNVINIGLFAWQIPTGLEIVGKVLQFTQLP